MSEHSSTSSSPDVPPRVAALVVAGGSGLRMGGGGGRRKQYADLLGEPVLARAVRPFSEHAAVRETVVVLPADDAARPPEWLLALGVRVTAGGAERSDSVRNGLAQLASDTDIVLVHDGARPFVRPELIDRMIAAARRGPAIPAVRATDTLKRVDADGFVAATVDRSEIWQAQTPQAFPFGVLVEAHRRAVAEGWPSTDDSALCERLGHRVRVVEGDPDNLKITRPTDLLLARALAAAEPAAWR